MADEIEATEWLRGVHDGDCQTRIRSTPPWCAHSQTWEVEVFSPGTRAWQTLRVCDPCMDDLRSRHFEIRTPTKLGPNLAAEAERP